MTCLIVAADDFGYAPSIDAAIAELAEAGTVSATSCLVLGPDWTHASQRLTPALRQRLDVGVHLDLSEFAPLLPWGRLVAAACLGRLDAGRVRAHVARQLDLFEARLGTPPDYIDGHRHVHQLPQVRDLLLDVLAARYSQALPWVRVSRPAGGGWKGRVITALGADGLARAARRRGLRATGRLLGVYDFGIDEAALRARMEGWMASARDGDALMVHVALEAATDDPIGAARCIEYRVLADPAFAALLARNGIRIVRGGVALAAETVQSEKRP